MQSEKCDNLCTYNTGKVNGLKYSLLSSKYVLLFCIVACDFGQRGLLGRDSRAQKLGVIEGLSSPTSGPINGFFGLSSLVLQIPFRQNAFPLLYG